MDGEQFHGEPRLLISRDALLHNARYLRRCVTPDTKICAMVKADAYGHGAGIVVDTLCNYAMDDMEPPAVDAFAVATLDEAAALPETNLPIMVLRPMEMAYVGRQRHELEQAVRAGWILTACTGGAIDDLARIAISTGRRANIQLLIDTGMSRAGVNTDELDALLERIDRQPSLRLWGLGTHLASADVPGDAYTAEQIERYWSAVEPQISGRLLGRNVVLHVAASAGIFYWPQTHLDLVRPGISLYGIDPTCRPCVDRPLRPAMKWTAPLLLLRNIAKGCAVGYGQTWRAPRDTRIGLVPVGYGDGYLRSFSNRAMMMVCGKPAPVVGRVSMDLTIIDLQDVPQATVGDDVTVLDDDPLSPASAYRLAELAESIPYEIFCRIGARVHRVAVEPAHQEQQQWDLRDSTYRAKSA